MKYTSYFIGQAFNGVKTENLILPIITCKSQKFFPSQTGLLQNSPESSPWDDFPFWNDNQSSSFAVSFYHGDMASLSPFWSFLETDRP
jgi:hypothetical protein